MSPVADASNGQDAPTRLRCWPPRPRMEGNAAGSGNIGTEMLGAGRCWYFWAPGHSGGGGRCWLWLSQGKGLECVGSFRVQRPLLLCCSAVRACRAALPLYYETHMILTPSDPSTPSRRDSDLPCSPEGVVFDRRPASVRQCSVATALCQTSDVRLSALCDA